MTIGRMNARLTPMKIVKIVMKSLALLMICGSQLPNIVSGQSSTTNLAPARTVFVDTNFTPRFEITGTVVSSAVQPDNKTIIAGNFSAVNGISRKGIARLNVDGTLDRAFELKVPGNIDSYYAVALQSDGKVLVAGYMFIVVGSGSEQSIRQYMVRLNADGALDPSFNVGAYFPVLETDNYIKTIAVQKDGKILVGGDFTKIHQISRNHIARLNADGSLDASFNPGEGANAAVLALAMQADGKILIGGDFTRFNGVNLNHVGRLKGDGSFDASFAVGSGVNGTVRAIAVQPNGRIAIGGSFTSPRSFLARFEADGRLDANLNDYHYYNVDAIVALPDNRIVVGGWNPVMIINGYPTDHNARVMTFQDNGVAANGRDFAGKPTDVLTLTRRPDGKILCGGSFRQTDEMNPVYRSGVCLLSELLQVNTGFAPIIGVAGIVNSVQKQVDGKLVAGGEFNLVNGVPQTNIARLNIDGSLDVTFKPALVGTEPVSSLVLQTDGKVVTVARSLSRLNSDGTKDTAFAYQTNTVQAPVYALAIQSDGKIIAAGTSMEARKGGIIRINPDGTVDSSFNVGNGIPSTFLPSGQGMNRINSLAIQPDGKILAAGAFQLFNNQARTNLVRLHQDGSVDVSFVLAAFTAFYSRYDAVLETVAVQSNGKIMVGGYFSKVGGRSCPSVARLNSDGSFDPSFISPITDSGGTVRVVVEHANGLLFIGGGFSLAQGGDNNDGNSLIRLAPNGARDPGFGISATGVTIHNINVLDSGNIMVGGAFNAINDTALFSIARLKITAASNSMTAPVITSSANSTAVPGSAYAYQISASNNPAGYGASGLPEGLVVNPSSGLISGKLSNPGTYSMGIAAFNASGAGTSTLTITALPQMPLLSVSLLVGEQVLVSWPASFTGFILESTDNIKSAQWQYVPNTPLTVVDRNYVTNNTASKAMFYRLKQP